MNRQRWEKKKAEMGKMRAEMRATDAQRTAILAQNLADEGVMQIHRANLKLEELQKRLEEAQRRYSEVWHKFDRIVNDEAVISLGFRQFSFSLLKQTVNLYRLFSGDSVNCYKKRNFQNVLYQNESLDGNI